MATPCVLKQLTTLESWALPDEGPTVFAGEGRVAAGEEPPQAAAVVARATPRIVMSNSDPDKRRLVDMALLRMASGRVSSLANTTALLWEGGRAALVGGRDDECSKPH
jgi:hypothetical protein